MKVVSNLWEVFLKRHSNPSNFIDCAGVQRSFNITGHYDENINVYSLVAKEILNTKEKGYQFSSYSYASPQDAMNKLKSKIRKELSTKYLDPNSDTPHLLNCSANGRISSGGVIIDGIFISWPKFTHMIQTYEGWDFQISLGDN